MARSPRSGNEPQVAYQKVDDACTHMLKITYYPDTYERTREIVPIDAVPEIYRCTPSRSNFAARVNIDDIVHKVSKKLPNSISEISKADLQSVVEDIHDTLLESISLNNIDLNTKRPSIDQIKNSIHHDYIISFIDGKRYQVLASHLRSHGLSFDDYRIKYGLPEDYPKFSRAYLEKLSQRSKNNKNKNAK